jgi:hypothetical protein
MFADVEQLLNCTSGLYQREERWRLPDWQPQDATPDNSDERRENSGPDCRVPWDVAPCSLVETGRHSKMFTASNISERISIFRPV